MTMAPPRKAAFRRVLVEKGLLLLLRAKAEYNFRDVFLVIVETAVAVVLVTRSYSSLHSFWKQPVGW